MKIFKMLALLFIAVITITLFSCDNTRRETLWDSGVIESVLHGGTFVGYASVYTIDWLNETKSRSSSTYPVYKKSNGTYIIDYNGDHCILRKATNPFGSGPYALKWQIDYNHYIEDIPTSW